MTVGELKEMLSNYDDNAIVYIFDSEAGEDIPLYSWHLTIDGEQTGENT